MALLTSNSPEGVVFDIVQKSIKNVRDDLLNDLDPKRSFTLECQWRHFTRILAAGATRINNLQTFMLVSK